MKGLPYLYGQGEKTQESTFPSDVLQFFFLFFFLSVTSFFLFFPLFFSLPERIWVVLFIGHIFILKFQHFLSWFSLAAFSGAAVIVSFMPLSVV